jgi:hypothetical protein
MDYRPIIESRYNRQNWQALLHDIFGGRIKFWNTPSAVPANSQFAKQALWLGTITLSDEQTISVYEVELSDSVDIERNRRGIRDMLLTTWRNNGNAGAFMFCYRKKESVLRFSYVSEAWTFADDGTYQKESTDAKRFTYLLGEGHRSRTAIQQFKTLRDSALSLKDLTKAFSVDAVSDMFFKEYKKNYEDIIFYVTGKRMVKVANKWEERQEGKPCEEIMQEFAHFQNPEKAVRDYVKKLMGRLVFLQFLQKKGWLGVRTGEPWGTGDSEFIQNLFAQTKDKDHFIDNVLEALFNDLNSEDQRKLPQYRTPYLNGGLFERDASDEANFPLPAKYMQQMLDFFSSYNFTIDENDPDDAEVGVDPEMLGRIFENLLEDNKDKGAFYTPKEIVTYMCRESLIAYLQTDVEDEPTKEAIRQFVTTHDAATLGNIAEDIDQRLKDVKICDPAIGSGAFPMGLLKELFLCRTALEGITQSKAAEIKKHIIQQNIYGVDIERGAVDIARLRFWLSLIVDEETPQALPNLDFKIMQGNSLLEQYKGVDLSTMTEITAEKQGIVQLTWFDNQLDVLRLNLREMLAKYYNCTNHNEKKQLRTSIINNVKQQLKEQSINVDFGDLDLSGNNQFMLWHTWFYDVFSQGGFDIVIGNPPYGADIDALIGVYGKLYPSTSHGFKDIYKYFFDFSLKIISPSGILSFITPNTYLRQPRYGDLRRVLLSKKIMLIVDLGEGIFKEAVVPVVITMVNRQEQLSNVKFADLVKTINSDNAYLLLTPFNYKLISQEIWLNTTNNIFIENTLVMGGEVTPLDEILNMKDAGFKYQRHNVGLANKGKNDLTQRIFYKGSFKKEDPRDTPILIGKDINAYYYNEYPDKVLRHDFEDKLKDNESTYYNKEIVGEPIKLIWRQTAPYFIGTILNQPIFFGNTIQAGIIKDNFKKSVSYEYLCGLLNSRYLRYLYEQIVKEGGRVFPQVKLEKLKPLPIILNKKDVQKKVEAIVREIISIKRDNQDNDTSALELEIDHLVYQLYGLTDEEIKIVEGCE